MFNKTSKFFHYNICCLYTTSICFIYVSLQFVVHCTRFSNCDRPPSWIFKFTPYLSKI